MQALELEVRKQRLRPVKSAHDETFNDYLLMILDIMAQRQRNPALNAPDGVGYLLLDMAPFPLKGKTYDLPVDFYFNFRKNQDPTDLSRISVRLMNSVVVGGLEKRSPATAPLN
jgi:hypothetical protein